MDEEKYIGASFSVCGHKYTVRESERDESTGESVFIATSDWNKNLIWRGSEQDLNHAFRNWVATLGRGC